MTLRPPGSTLLPYTTVFRSGRKPGDRPGGWGFSVHGAKLFTRILAKNPPPPRLFENHFGRRSIKFSCNFGKVQITPACFYLFWKQAGGYLQGYRLIKKIFFKSQIFSNQPGGRIQIQGLQCIRPCCESGEMLGEGIFHHVVYLWPSFPCFL